MTEIRREDAYLGKFVIDLMLRVLPAHGWCWDGAARMWRTSDDRQVDFWEAHDWALRSELAGQNPQPIEDVREQLAVAGISVVGALERVKTALRAQVGGS